MKTYSTISLLILLSFSFTGLLAQPKAQDSDNKLVLVKVASLNTIDSNKEFQKNVQLVQQQRSLAAQVLSKIEASKNQKEKAELQAQFDSLQKKLNENNQLMFKTYGFSLNRNYVLTVEKSHIHMWVTEKEADAINQRRSADNDDKEPKAETGIRSLFKRKK